jgi:hypothetical protein
MPRDRVTEILEAAWDAGNCTGLDGWVGPGRGAGEVDGEALHARDRDVSKYSEPLLAELEGLRAKLAAVEELAGEHWDWKAGCVLADRLRAALHPNQEGQGNE